jgi:hypothetical protein
VREDSRDTSGLVIWCAVLLGPTLLLAAFAAILFGHGRETWHGILIGGAVESALTVCALCSTAVPASRSVPNGVLWALVAVGFAALILAVGLRH